MVSKIFASCSLIPVVGTDSSSSLAATSSAGTSFKASSFYFDSAGRSTVSLPLELKFPSKEALDEFIAADCIHPPPSNLSTDSTASTETKEEETPKEDKDKEPSRWSLAIEAKVTLTFGTGEAISATIEDIMVVSSRLQDASILFDTEIVVRVSRPGGERLESNDESRVKTNLEVSAVLSEKVQVDNEGSVALQGLRTLNLGGFPDLDSVNTQTMGKTLVSLTMRHSNTHTEPVTVTNIALHPGHSRQNTEGANKAAFLDMTKSFQWGYAQKCGARLPLVLGPHEAFSTIITIDAPNDACSRTFSSPVSVTAVVGRKDSEGVRGSSHRYNVVVAKNVKWRTTVAPVEPADAFRVDMTLQETECVVGAPFEVSLDVLNLSSEVRDLMLMIENESQDVMASIWASYEKKPAIVETAPQSFSVVGVSGAVQGIPSKSDRELLAMDMALLLGEVKAHSSATAALRFIPLREGTLAVPFLKLVDKKSGKWYNCIHSLRVVAKRA